MVLVKVIAMTAIVFIVALMAISTLFGLAGLINKKNKPYRMYYLGQLVLQISVVILGIETYLHPKQVLFFALVILFALTLRQIKKWKWIIRGDKESKEAKT